jgi:hypothetical protein
MEGGGTLHCPDYTEDVTLHRSAKGQGPSAVEEG